MKGFVFKDGIRSTCKLVLCGIIAASFMLASSGCHDWNGHGDYRGYGNERRWDADTHRTWRYSQRDWRESDWKRT